MALPTLTPDRIRRGTALIALGRGALGVATVVAPLRSSRAGGFDSELGAAGRVMLALFGVREVALAWATLHRLRDGYPSPTLLRLNAVVDAGDAAILTRGLVSGGRIGRLAWGLPLSVTVTVAEVAMARALDEM